MADGRKIGGVRHVHSTEKLLAFRDVPAEAKLQWLEEMRQLLEKALTPEKVEILRRFRRGDL